jgi:hypothetical protein
MSKFSPLSQSGYFFMNSDSYFITAPGVSTVEKDTQADCQVFRHKSDRNAGAGKDPVIFRRQWT